MKQAKLFIHLIIEPFFQYALVTYLILLLAETIKEGIVSFFFNINILLGIVLVSGIIMVLTQDEAYDKELHPQKNAHIRKIDILYIMLLALGGAAIILDKTQDLGIIALPISFLAGGIILFLSILVFTNSEN